MRRMLLMIVICLAGTLTVNAAEQNTAKPVPPKRVQVDANFDGKPDRVEIYDLEGNIKRLETDTNEDGVIDEWIVFDKSNPIKKEKDTNGDGKPDVWIDY